MTENRIKLARVIVHLSLDRSFDYIIPEHLEPEIFPGVQVVVPFAYGTRNGFVLSLENESEYPLNKIKYIKEVRGDHPNISPSLMKLAEWMAEYYCCSLEQAVRALLPGAVRSGKQKKKTVDTFFLKVSAEDAQKFIFEQGRRSKAKSAILKVLMHHHGITRESLLREAGVRSSAVINQLIQASLIEKEKKTVLRDPFANISVIATKPQKPTREQQKALEVIFDLLNGKNEKHAILLHGVTGSGKTEVYLQAIEKVLISGKEAIVLVPEISLTPQTTERFRARFGDLVSVLHSALGDGERYDEWMKIYEGKVKIAVGARSALFAPFRNLGLIVVDEEHENSYKQDEAPRYHARDVAVMRGYMENAAVILGSATPSLESVYNTQKGKYLLLELTRRVDDFLMPEMRVVDMRNEAIETGGAKIFSRDLASEIYNRVTRGEQTIIFLNRRGFATQMLCQKCGYVAECLNCSIAYTYHRKRSCLSCHLCGTVIPAPVLCPKCHAEEIRYSGLGTEKIESAAKKLFPTARIARMDSDTMTAKNCYEKTLNAFRAGGIDILIGTQMIAKGLHFPNVTLVGIVYADLSLHIPDFRAHERTFQLLTQVAGRAGRGEISGKVIVQTYTPFNPAIQYALNHDFKGFFDEEIEIRKALTYPPAGHLIVVHFRGIERSAVEAAANSFANAINPYLHEQIFVSGPAPAPLEKIKNKYRFQIIYRGKMLKNLRAVLRHYVLHVKHPKGVKVYIDADAVSMS